MHTRTGRRAERSGAEGLLTLCAAGACKQRDEQHAIMDTARYAAHQQTALRHADMLKHLSGPNQTSQGMKNIWEPSCLNRKLLSCSAAAQQH